MLEVVPHQETWIDEFRRLQATLKETFQDKALAISHIGSTAISGLAAKPIIDIQVSVEELDVLERIKLLPNAFQHIVNNGARHAHIHIRQKGRANERIALLFRDFLIHHPLHREAYGQLKLRLAEAVGCLATESGSGPYVELKDPLIAVILSAAEEWSRTSGWSVAEAR